MREADFLLAINGGTFEVRPMTEKGKWFIKDVMDGKHTFIGRGSLDEFIIAAREAGFSFGEETKRRTPKRLNEAA